MAKKVTKKPATKAKSVASKAIPVKGKKATAASKTGKSSAPEKKKSLKSPSTKDVKASKEIKEPAKKPSSSLTPSTLTAKSKTSRSKVEAERPVKSAELSKKVEVSKSKGSFAEGLDLQNLSENQKQWLQTYEKHKNEVSVDYKLSGQYEPNTCLVHKVMGWGYILNVQDDRLEVLFKDGMKFLISNYNPK